MQTSKVTMEHRHGKRIDVQLDVQLYRQGVPVGAGKIRNVSHAGVFVETSYMPENGNWYVDVVLNSNNVIKWGASHLKGLTVHSTPEGFGMIIDDSDPESRWTAQIINTRWSELEGHATNAERTRIARYPGLHDTRMRITHFHKR